MLVLFNSEACNFHDGEYHDEKSACTCTVVAVTLL